MTVLILDDEPLVRAVICRALTGAGYEVLEAANASEAISAAAQYCGVIELFMTDHCLKNGLTGRQVAEDILGSRPAMRVLHMSGYPERDLVQDGSLIPGGYYLAKPFLPKDVIAKIDEILGNPSPR